MLPIIVRSNNSASCQLLDRLAMLSCMYVVWNNKSTIIIIAILILQQSHENKSMPYHLKASIDVLPSKNQALCEYCTHAKRIKTLLIL